MSIELGLGLSIIALITSVLGLILHFIKFRKENPDLHIEDIKCEHHPPSAQVKQTQLRIRFYVHNKGDRGTQLNNLELQTYGKILPLDKEVGAHKSIQEDCYFDFPVRITDEILQCTFILHHTHNEKKFQATSRITTRNLSKVGVGVLD